MISRRDFIRRLGIGVGAAAVGAKLPQTEVINDYEIVQSVPQGPIGIALNDHTIVTSGFFEVGEPVALASLKSIGAGVRVEPGMLVYLKDDGKFYPYE